MKPGTLNQKQIQDFMKFKNYEIGNIAAHSPHFEWNKGPGHNREYDWTQAALLYIGILMVRNGITRSHVLYALDDVKKQGLSVSDYYFGHKIDDPVQVVVTNAAIRDKIDAMFDKYTPKTVVQTKNPDLFRNRIALSDRIKSRRAKYDGNGG